LAVVPSKFVDVLPLPDEQERCVRPVDSALPEREPPGILGWLLLHLKLAALLQLREPPEPLHAYCMENNFLEAIRKLVEYGNREFLRSF
jgi:hypothetical protein